MDQNPVDDELKQMDESNDQLNRQLNVAVSLGDPIQSLRLQKSVIVSPDTTIAAVTKAMLDNSVGCVLVEKDDRLAGVFTERDIMRRILGRGLDHKKITVGEYMTPDPEFLHMDDPIAFALNRMSVGGFRHVVLVDNQNKPIGFVSVRDIVDYIVDFYDTTIFNLPPEPLREGWKSQEGA